MLSHQGVTSASSNLEATQRVKSRVPSCEYQHFRLQQEYGRGP